MTCFGNLITTIWSEVINHATVAFNAIASGLCPKNEIGKDDKMGALQYW